MNTKQNDGKPIALEAYEILAERYAAIVDSKGENAYVERPATLSLVPDVKGKRILDAGCGSGSYSEWLVDQGAEVVGVDFSPKMIEISRRRLRNRVQLYEADLNKPLSFLEADYFDIVLAPLVLDYLEDLGVIFSEFNRILNKSGLLVFSVEHPFAKFIFHRDQNYFNEELVKVDWRGFGILVSMPSYRRPLSAIFSSLAETGFVVEQLIEPQPTEECKRKDPRTYERLHREPGFLCIRARKNS